MARYLFHSLTAAAALAMVSGPTVCFAANGADAGGGAAPKPKTKAKDAPAGVSAAPAPAAAAATAAETPAAPEAAQADAGGGAAAPDQPAPEAPSEANPASLGFANIRQDGATSVSHGGQTYEADKNGVITVPLSAVEDLVSHGFVLV